MAQQALGGHDDSGRRKLRLSCRRRAWKYWAGVVRLQTWMLSSAQAVKIALEVGVGVLRALALVAVGQQHDEPADPLPLVEGGGDELVDDDLGAVGEVAELRLPDHQHVRLDQRVAVVEAEHRRLGQHAVVDAEPRLVRFDVVERDVDLLGLGVEPGGVAVGEGAADAVLAAETDRGSLEQQGAEGQQLGERPVHRALALDRLADAPAVGERPCG